MITLIASLLTAATTAIVATRCYLHYVRRADRLDVLQRVPRPLFTGAAVCGGIGAWWPWSWTVAIILIVLCVAAQLTAAVIAPATTKRLTVWAVLRWASGAIAVAWIAGLPMANAKVAAGDLWAPFRHGWWLGAVVAACGAVVLHNRQQHRRRVIADEQRRATYRAAAQQASNQRKRPANRRPQQAARGAR